MNAKIQRQFRYRLKAAIVSRGHKTVREFCEANGLDESKMSRIIGGWEIPNDHFIEVISKGLKLSKSDTIQFM